MGLRTPPILTLAFSLNFFAAPLAAEAQQIEKTPRIGYATPGPPECRLTPPGEAFLRGLREFGYLPGENLMWDRRCYQSDDQAANMIADFVRLRVDVIVVAGTSQALLAKRATATIPIVFATAGDPVGSGLVESLARPGGNLTGLSVVVRELTAKTLELLKETVPGISRVAMLLNPSNPISAALWEDALSAAEKLKVQLQRVEARSGEEIDKAFAAMLRGRADAVVVVPDGVFYPPRAKIATLALQHRLPSIHQRREEVTAGGLLAYSLSMTDQFRRTGIYVGKILKGAKPADLPVERPTKFELVINLKTAKALGLTIPPSLLLRADEVIE
jgi:putative ABC transport system substrate-binding protein